MLDLSICIPVYNQRPYPLLQALKAQVQTLRIKAEIFLLDDGSNTETRYANKAWCLGNGIRYEELNKNQGRSVARNQLAARAKGEFLLFLDGDARINRMDFLGNYWRERKEAQVLCGGITVELKPKKNCELRWRYAQAREMKDITERNRMPYQRFLSGNFFAHHTVFERISFEERLKTYGHEDTLFGLNLAKLEISLKHIEAPAFFATSDSNDEFMEKTTQALRNLKFLGKWYPDLVEVLPLLRIQAKLSFWGARFLMGLIGSLLNPLLKVNLRSSQPSLRLFDLYRLLTLLQLK